jgi:SAM-dependent methyltransferase
MTSTAAVQPGGLWAEQAYEAIAPVYDDFTAHHDYELWLGNLLPKVRLHGLSGHRLLDVGCGTGKSFLPMLERGWEITACDISPSMLQLAQAKAGDAAQLSVADMRKLPVFGEFDLVWALDDALNYLLSGEELGDALRGMRANLAPGGLMMFDVNTLQAYRTFFAEEQLVERDGRQLLWRGQGSVDAPPGSISEALFEVKSANGAKVETHVHLQRHFPEAEVLDQLEGAGLKCLDVYGHGFDAVPKQPVEELVHSKIVFIACSA